MIKKRIYFYALLVINALTIVSGCGDENRDNKETIRILETNIKTLEEGAKISTFPLTIIIADKMYGDAMPDNMQQLCALSKNTCKTLPIAGLLRLGSNNYYEYNNISALNIPDKIKNNEADATDTVNKQVISYLSSVKLKEYDSLLSPNHPDWNIQSLSQDYIGNSTDSIFFFSESLITANLVMVGTKSYPVYYNIGELRKRIDEIICKSQKTVSVFYNPAPVEAAPPPVSKVRWSAKGTPAGDTCIDQSKYEKLHDGNGGFMAGNLVELNSASCGFKFPTGLAGDTCVKNSKYQKIHNGKGGFALGSLIEANSKACGFVFPAGQMAGDTCISGSKYQKLHDGKGGFMTGKLVEQNSRSCGFVYPTGVAGDTCVSGSKYQKLHNGKGGFKVGALIEKNSRSCGFAFPAGVAGDTCVGGFKYQKLHNGKGGFGLGRLIEKNSRSCGFVFPTGVAGDSCVSGSKYQKMHNGKGGYSLGKLIERNSKSCGFAFPTGLAGDTCVSGSKYQKLHNGKGGFTLGKLIERNSKSCGFAFPTGVAGDTCVSGSRYQKLHNGKGGFSVGRMVERNSKACGFSFPAAGTQAAGFICEKGSKYAKLNDGKGGFTRGTLLEANSSSCRVPVLTPDNVCATKSDAICEKDSAGNYTGRRVQYCYNKSGRIIRTIVLVKCDGDCRCLGN